ncbi:MAG: M12 family metallo-peptidase, partial [Bacteroidota bacterium]
MSRKLLLHFFLLLLAGSLAAQSSPVELFELAPTTKSTALDRTVTQRTELRLTPDALTPDRAPETLRLALPGGQFGDFELELERARVLTDDFTLLTGDSPAEPIAHSAAAHYRGKVVGDAHSTVAFSLLDDAVIAAIQTERGSFILGRAQDGKGKALDRHVLYREQDLLVAHEFDCHTESTPLSKEDRKLMQRIAAGEFGRTKSNNCVRVYIELDDNLVTQKGGVTQAVTYMESLWNMVATLYQNEGIDTKISQIFAWTPTSPMPYTDLFGFTNGRQSFNGDLAHLVTTSGPTGGRAWINALCANTNRHAYSRIETTFQPVPTYSWSVMVLAHEMGHNLGSRHTHDCVWGPDNDSPIDGCAFNSNSSCPQGPIPSGGGTIMSYCHLLGNVGINFNLGFGPEPGNVIRASVANATCLSSCTTSGCFSINATIVPDGCNGSGTGSATVSAAGGTAPYTYQWSSGGTTATETGLTAGNYSVTITDATSCSEVLPVTVGTSTPPTLITEGWGASGIANGRARVRASGGTPPYTYLWSNGATVADVTGLTGPATYTVTVIDAVGCIATGDFFVRDEITQAGSCNGTVVRLLFEMDQNDDQIYFQFNDGQGTPLFGQYPGVYTEPGGLLSYTFCIPDGCYEMELFDSGRDGLCGPNSNPQGNFRFEDVTNGTDILNVCSIPDTIYTPFCFGGPSNLTLTTSTTTPTCYGGNDGTATVTATGGSGNYNYSWSNGGTTSTITNLTGGTYSVVVTDGSSSQSATVTVGQPNVFTATMSSTNTVQGGTTGTATANPIGGLAPIAYAWSNGGTTQTITGLAAGIYSCTLTDANGCSDTRNVEVSATCADVTLNVTITNVTCNGGNDGMVEIVATGGDGNYTYNWGSNVTGSGPTLTNLAQGIYSVTVTSCSKVAFASNVISEPSAININLDVTDATSGNNGAIDATVTGGMGFYSYAWSNNATTEDLTNLAPGTYTLTATDAFGCPATATATVQDNSIAQIPLERGRVLVTDDSWQTITYSGQYTSPVVVATPVLVDRNDDPVVARVRNVTASSFQVRV